MVALAVTFSLHAHSHTAWLFPDSEILDVFHVFGFRNEFDVVLFYLLVGLDIS